MDIQELKKELLDIYINNNIFCWDVIDNLTTNTNILNIIKIKERRKIIHKKLENYSNQRKEIMIFYERIKRLKKTKNIKLLLENIYVFDPITNKQIRIFGNVIPFTPKEIKGTPIFKKSLINILLSYGYIYQAISYYGFEEVKKNRMDILELFDKKLLNIQRLGDKTFVNMELLTIYKKNNLSLRDMEKELFLKGNSLNFLGKSSIQRLNKELKNTDLTKKTIPKYGFRLRKYEQKTLNSRLDLLINTIIEECYEGYILQRLKEGQTDFEDMELKEIGIDETILYKGTCGTFEELEKKVKQSIRPLKKLNTTLEKTRLDLDLVYYKALKKYNQYIKILYDIHEL